MKGEEYSAKLKDKYDIISYGSVNHCLMYSVTTKHLDHKTANFYHQSGIVSMQKILQNIIQSPFYLPNQSLKKSTSFKK